MGATLPNRVKEWLDDKMVVSFATISPSGQPHISPVWATYDGDDILLSTLESRQKFKNLSQDPHATVLIFPLTNPYIYAELRGTVTLSHDGARELLDRLAVIYTGEPYPAEAPEEVRVTVRLHLSRVSGRVSDEKSDAEALADYVVPDQDSSNHPAESR